MRLSRLGATALVAIATGLSAPAAHGTLVISELYYDHPGADADHEFLELFNGGVEPMSLDGWIVEWAGAAWGEAGVALAGLVPPGRFFLVGGALTGSDFGVTPDLVRAFTFQNGGTATDGVRLRHGAYTDTVLYDQPNTSGLTAESGWDGSFAPDVPAGHSLARRVPWLDTDAMTDFEERVVPGPTNRWAPGPREGVVPEPGGAATFGAGIGWGIWRNRCGRQRRRT